MRRAPGIGAKALFTVATAAVLVAAGAGAVPVAPKIAVLQGLDKITARTSRIEAPVGSPVRFGTLEILVKRCEKRPPEETPETTVYLDIREHRPGEAAVDLFSGWMFASSPAVSALEHPVYDVWVIDCKNATSSD